jgi:hypothetical protein
MSAYITQSIPVVLSQVLLLTSSKSPQSTCLLKPFFFFFFFWFDDDGEGLELLGELRAEYVRLMYISLSRLSEV